ncbi:hypothetical protein Tco_0925911 [Tanacetum coccineum]|uniref:Maturase K n=1 Tax=Tanacetum coccineum TaxID=301880 RepID=A0ABQ5DAS4_9ASTR
MDQLRYLAYPQKIALAVEIDLLGLEGLSFIRDGRHTNLFLKDLVTLLIVFPRFLPARSRSEVDRVHRIMYSKLLLKFFLLPFVDNPSYCVVPCIVRIRPEQRTLSHLVSLFLIRDC